MTNEQILKVSTERHDLKESYFTIINKMKEVQNSKEYIDLENKLDEMLDNGLYGSLEFVELEAKYDNIMNVIYDEKLQIENKCIDFLVENVDPIYEKCRDGFVNLNKALTILFK